MVSVNLNASLKVGMAVVGTLVGFILVSTFLSESAGDVGAAAGNMSCTSNCSGNNTASGGASVYALTGLFKKKGVLLLIIPVLVFAGLVAIALKTFKK